MQVKVYDLHMLQQKWSIKFAYYYCWGTTGISHNRTPHNWPIKKYVGLIARYIEIQCVHIKE